jgi:hypothetical protein
MTEGVPGGISYSLPLNELPDLLAVVHRGAAFCSTNQVPLPPALVKRIHDLEVTVAAMRPVAREPEMAPSRCTPSATPLHPVRVDDMDDRGPVVVSPATAARMLGCSRQRVNRRLLDGSLPGWQDESRRWHIRVSDLEGAQAKGA